MLPLMRSEEAQSMYVVVCLPEGGTPRTLPPGICTCFQSVPLERVANLLIGFCKKKKKNAAEIMECRWYSSTQKTVTSALDPPLSTGAGCNVMNSFMGRSVMQETSLFSCCRFNCVPRPPRHSLVTLLGSCFVLLTQKS